MFTSEELSYIEQLEDRINLLEDLCTELTNKLLAKEVKFKPIDEMTVEDWKKAYYEEWSFRLRDGALVRIVELDEFDGTWDIKSQRGWHRIDGTFNPNHQLQDPLDIVERIL